MPLQCSILNVAKMAVKIIIDSVKKYFIFSFFEYIFEQFFDNECNSSERELN